jgi:hypothetical protein
LREGIGDEERARKSCLTERRGGKGGRLEDNRRGREELRVGGKSKWDSTKLRGDGHPGNGAMREEEVTAGAGGGGRFNTGIIGSRTRNGSEAERKVGQKGLHGIGRHKG